MPFLFPPAPALSPFALNQPHNPGAGATGGRVFADGAAAPPRLTPLPSQKKVGLDPEVKAKLKVKSLLTSGLRCGGGRRGCPRPRRPPEPPRRREELGPPGGFAERSSRDVPG